MSPRRIDWVVMRKDREPDEDGICLRCGDIFFMRKPIRLEVWCAGIKAFVKVHSTCRPKKPETP
jgi:hypothetical protein